MIWVFIHINHLMDQFNTEMIDLKKKIYFLTKTSMQLQLYLWSMQCSVDQFLLSFPKKIIPLNSPPPPLRPQLNDWAMYAMKLKEFKWPVWPPLSRHFVDIILFQFVRYIGIAVWKVTVIFVILDRKREIHLEKVAGWSTP